MTTNTEQITDNSQLDYYIRMLEQNPKERGLCKEAESVLSEKEYELFLNYAIQEKINNMYFVKKAHIFYIDCGDITQAFKNILINGPELPTSEYHKLYKSTIDHAEKESFFLDHKKPDNDESDPFQWIMNGIVEERSADSVDEALFSYNKVITDKVYGNAAIINIIDLLNKYGRPRESFEYIDAFWFSQRPKSASLARITKQLNRIEERKWYELVNDIYEYIISSQDNTYAKNAVLRRKADLFTRLHWFDLAESVYDDYFHKSNKYMFKSEKEASIQINTLGNMCGCLLALGKIDKAREYATLLLYRKSNNIYAFELLDSIDQLYRHNETELEKKYYTKIDDLIYRSKGLKRFCANPVVQSIPESEYESVIRNVVMKLRPIWAIQMLLLNYQTEQQYDKILDLLYGTIINNISLRSGFISKYENPILKSIPPEFFDSINENDISGHNLITIGIWYEKTMHNTKKAIEAYISALGDKHYGFAAIEKLLRLYYMEDDSAADLILNTLVSADCTYFDINDINHNNAIYIVASNCLGERKGKEHNRLIRDRKSVLKTSSVKPIMYYAIADDALNKEGDIDKAEQFFVKAILFDDNASEALIKLYDLMIANGNDYKAAIYLGIYGPICLDENALAQKKEDFLENHSDKYRELLETDCFMNNS